MHRIETALARYRGVLVLFVDECDHVRRDKDTFMSFLVRRLPQRIPAKLILIFASNRLDWPDHLDPRVKSFLKLNELIFRPYDAVHLQQILRIRANKALQPEALASGVIEKIAGVSSRDHSDARRAVALLARSAYLAEKAGAKVSLALVDEAAAQLDQDRYLRLLRTAPAQLQAAIGAVIEAAHGTWEWIFKEQLNGWMRDPKYWPKELTREMFLEWFDCELSTMIWDMLKTKIKPAF